MIISDNGANMVKAVRLLNERHLEEQRAEESEVDDDEESEDEVEDEENPAVEMIELADIQEAVSYRRLMCMAHSLQLVIKKAYIHYDNLLVKVRRIVSRVRKSSVAVEKLKHKTGKVLLSDNSTRWNSTYRMAERITEIRDAVNEVLTEQKIDTLLVSEWTRLSEMCELLKPFAVQTDKLQTNSQSISYILPSLMELEYHLQCSTAPRAVTKGMLDDMRIRFQSIRNPASDSFNPLPAASCLLDPTVASILLTEDMNTLLEAAQDFILSEVLTISHH